MKFLSFGIFIAPSEKDQWACDQMLIFASTKGWAWTEEKVVNFVIDSLHHYAKNVNNERAFSFFAELCGKLTAFINLFLFKLVFVFKFLKI